jgi:hypothetical protein
LRFASSSGVALPRVVKSSEISRAVKEDNSGLSGEMLGTQGLRMFIFVRNLSRCSHCLKFTAFVPLLPLLVSCMGNMVFAYRKLNHF